MGLNKHDDLLDAGLDLLETRIKQVLDGIMCDCLNFIIHFDKLDAENKHAVLHYAKRYILMKQNGVSEDDPELQFITKRVVEILNIQKEGSPE